MKLMFAQLWQEHKVKNSRWKLKQLPNNVLQVKQDHVMNSQVREVDDGRKTRKMTIETIDKTQGGTIKSVS